jgi:hypothetical protein
MNETYDIDSPVATLLMEVLPWVEQGSRELMIEELAAKLGTEAGELIKRLYHIHQVNGTGD